MMQVLQVAARPNARHAGGMAELTQTIDNRVLEPSSYEQVVMCMAGHATATNALPQPPTAARDLGK